MFRRSEPSRDDLSPKEIIEGRIGTRVPAPAAPTSSLAARARAAAEAEKKQVDTLTEKHLAWTIKIANDNLRNVLGVGPLQWHEVPNLGKACSIRAELDGFAIFFDSVNRHLHWGGKAITKFPLRSRL